MAKTDALVITPFHRDMFAACAAVRKAERTMLTKMQALLTSKYGEKCPTFEQFRADRAALKAIADEKGLKDDQWVRKPYNAAVKALYGELPVAQTAAAIAKRKLREAQEAANPKPAEKSGAKKGETAQRAPSAGETIEQFIARMGVFKVLEQCVNILEAVDETKAVAQAIKKDVMPLRKAA